jgi:hypothetical protein
LLDTPLQRTIVDADPRMVTRPALDRPAGSRRVAGSRRMAGARHAARAVLTGLTGVGEMALGGGSASFR